EHRRVVSTTQLGRGKEERKTKQKQEDEPAEAKIGIEPIGLCSKIPNCNQKCKEVKKTTIGGICYRRSPRDTEDTCGCFIIISYIAS
ncbi:hypothetical protein HID58_033010, partial [Brassica napus]